MAGLDEMIAGWAQQGSAVTVLLVATLLGLRHATDPDHMVAVATLAAAGERRAAARLGVFWGVGHGIALVLLGLPIVLYRAYLPPALEHAAELAIAAIVVLFAARLVVRHRRPRGPARSPLAALAIGLVHGAAGSASLGVLLLAAISSHALAVAALLSLALFSAISMTLLTAGLSATLLARGRPSPYVTYAVAAAGLTFGVWYAAVV